MNTTAFIWRKTMLRYLSAGIICSKKCTVFQEHSQTKTVSFGEQRTGQISKHYFHATWGYCVNCSSNIFCNTCCFENLEITHGYFPVLAGGIFRKLLGHWESKRKVWFCQELNTHTPSQITTALIYVQPDMTKCENAYLFKQINQL